ncbi:T9SS type A sorting domain-containing protein [Algoriphagus lutimaris]|uniref:T9SS type A sorting domain-containing protein n=1 Tax=Algoriphagus lutimaris TaxID=613197 RepID=UPI00196AC2DF|nr:T9SS type A sorting domain-containing protein [Algoriphagus lutimaris]MBN3519383.1 T9SS type A sorting domain-containing protein [Algoriphagus lutimaris]
MLKRISFLLLFFLACISVQASVKYASPLGNSSNSGNDQDHPWSLAYALGVGSALVAGDSLILMDGTYEGNFESYLNGTIADPIIVVAQHDGMAIIDVGKNRTNGTGLLIYGSYTWFVGLKVTSSSSVRSSDASNGFAEIKDELGITVLGDNIKIINCWVYDIVGGGIELWRNGFNNEVYGSIIFNNGSQGDTRGNGHGFYVQHQDENQPKILENNIVFQNASQGINLYTTDPENKGVKVIRNVSFNTGVIATVNLSVHRPPHNFTVGSRNNLSSEVFITDNVFYRDLQASRLTADQVRNVTLGRTYMPNENIRFRENLIYGGGNLLEILPLNNLEIQSNRFFNVHGNFYAVLGDKTSFPNASWNSNFYFNINNIEKPFNELTFEDWKNNYGFDLESQLSTNPISEQEVLITQNKYDPSKFYVTILKLNTKPEAFVDFSEFGELKGKSYEIIDFQNPFDPIQKVEGVFEGSSISFPMNWNKSMQPNGNMPFTVVHTDVTFGTFLIHFKTSEDQPAPVFKEEIRLSLAENGLVSTEASEYFLSGYSEAYTYYFSRELNYTCADLGLTEVLVKVKSEGVVKWEGMVKVTVLDELKPELTLKEYKGTIDVTFSNTFEINQEYIIAGISDNCGENLEVIYGPKTIGCEDFDTPVKIEITVKDQSGNTTTGITYLTIEKIESRKVSLNGPATAAIGSEVLLELGSEFDYQVIGWYKGEELISSSTSKVLTIQESGVYSALILPFNGCPVYSKVKEVEFYESPPTGEKPYPSLKEQIELPLNENGIGELSIMELFTASLPEGLTVILNQQRFTCENLGEQQIVVTIKDLEGNFWKEEVKVKVIDLIPPVLETKNLELELDLSVGSLILEAEDFVSEVSDNCAIQELKINQAELTCESVGKEIQVEIRAVDASGNVTEKNALVFVKGMTSKPVILSGPESICSGDTKEISLDSEAVFEVVRWRRNGIEIQGENGKSLEIEEGGVYHAVIRYEGGCLAETEKIEITTLERPAGEILEDGNVLIAPDGDFEYQWYRNGEMMEGETGSTLELNQMGLYTVEITNLNGCTSTLGPVEITISGLIGGVIVSQELKIYPNPVFDEVVLETAGDFEFIPDTWKVRDANGKEVNANITLISQNSSRIVLDIRSLASGVYLVAIEGEEKQMFLGRILKVK